MIEIQKEKDDPGMYRTIRIVPGGRAILRAGSNNFLCSLNTPLSFQMSTTSKNVFDFTVSHNVMNLKQMLFLEAER